MPKPHLSFDLHNPPKLHQMIVMHTISFQKIPIHLSISIATEQGTLKSESNISVMRTKQTG